MNRRNFLGAAATLGAGAMLPTFVRGTAPSPTLIPMKQPKIPRYRGFNLPNLTDAHPGAKFDESDFALLQEWGFTFARLPLNYWVWSDKHDWLKINGDAFKPVDEAMEFGRAHGIHLNLCLHRIPGYCVNGRELEPHRLFDSTPDDMALALEAATLHWRYVAKRYAHIPSDRLSFDLLNEPPFMKDHPRYITVARTLIAAIREVSPDRLIFVDGADIGQTPILGIVDLGVVQSTRGYLPKMLTHYTASWVPKNEFESLALPTWPMTDASGRVWNRATLKAELIDKWQPLVQLGVPIHVGEWGCFNRTPHAATLGWMRDILALWKDAGWGWSMWNLRGDFGPIDSKRADVRYETFRGHQVDRAMLDLLLSDGQA